MGLGDNLNDHDLVIKRHKQTGTYLTQVILGYGDAALGLGMSKEKSTEMALIALLTPILL